MIDDAVLLAAASVPALVCALVVVSVHLARALTPPRRSDHDDDLYALFRPRHDQARPYDWARD